MACGSSISDSTPPSDSASVNRRVRETIYMVWVAAADPQDLREFVVDHLASHPSVAHAETSLIYEHQRGPGFWGAAEAA